MDKKQKTACPKCTEIIEVGIRSCVVSANKVLEKTPENVTSPKLSRLHETALEDLTELGAENALRHATVNLRIKKQVAWAQTSGYPDKNTVRDSFTSSKLFNCPHCGAELNVMLDFTVVAAVEVLREPNDTVSPKRAWATGPAADFLDMCRNTGVLPAFEQAVSEQIELEHRRGNKSVQKPTCIESFFLNFIKNASRSFQRHPMFDQISKEEGGGVQYWRTNGIGLITVGDQVYRFIPALLLTQDIPDSPLAKKLSPRTSHQEPVGANGLESWVKSRYGYVPLSHQLFLSELRQKSFGSFGTKSGK